MTPIFGYHRGLRRLAITAALSAAFWIPPLAAQAAPLTRSAAASTPSATISVNRSGKVSGAIATPTSASRSSRTP